MNVEKLIKAAQMIEDTHPELSQELKNTADQLSDVPSPSVVDPMNLNPNVKNYGNTQTPQSDKPTVHEITFSFEVGPEIGETELLNHAWEALKNYPGIKDNQIKVKSFSFDKK
jgi:hypothetical protein